MVHGGRLRHRNRCQVATTLGCVAGRVPIRFNGVSAPLGLPLAASNTCSRSLAVEIALVAAAVDTMLKDSIEAGRKILGLGGEVKRMGMS
jgi:hypothetical protein